MDAELGPCLEWAGAKNSNGYGNRKIGGRKGRNVSTHRWAWECAYGPIPVGMHVLHRCDNPPCYRLDHLYLGTNADNIADKVKRGRAGVKLTPEQVREIRSRLNETNRALATEYGVAPSSISHIRTGRFWAWITG